MAGASPTKDCLHCSKVQQVERFLRSVFRSVAAKSLPLLAIHVSEIADSFSVQLTWDGKSAAIDDCVDAADDFTEKKLRFSNPYTGIRRKQTSLRGEEVMLKEFSCGRIADLSAAFQETLIVARTSHKNTCNYRDFRLAATGNGRYRACLAMEKLDADLKTEIRNRRSLQHAYGEAELWWLLSDISSALLHAKGLGLAHGNVKPAHIAKCGVYKLLDFGSMQGRVEWWLPSVTNSEFAYRSPETRYPMKECDRTASDVFSLGLSVLDAASLAPTTRTGGESAERLEALISQRVQQLPYSASLKTLLLGMTAVAPQSRPSLEVVQAAARRAQPIPQQSLSESAQERRREAETLCLEARALSKSQDASAALAKFAAADAILSECFPTDLSTANNLRDWAFLLCENDRRKEALFKFAAADCIYARYHPKTLDAGINLRKWAVLYWDAEENVQAAEKFAAADAVLSCYFPTDLQTAHNFSNWSQFYREIGDLPKALAKRKAANALYCRCFPLEECTADSLRCIALLYSALGDNLKAIKKHAAAHAIYSKSFPNDLDAASNLSAWGDAHGELGEHEQAIEKHAMAHAILSRYFPTNEATAINLAKWATRLHSMGQVSKAVDKLLAADAILSRHFPAAHRTASILNELAHIYKQLGQQEKALACFEAADRVYSLYNPTCKGTATNLDSWGILCKDRGMLELALEKFAAADEIYSRHFSRTIENANNLWNWGMALEKTGKHVLAAQKIETARAIYIQEEAHKDIADCDRVLGRLRRRT